MHHLQNRTEADAFERVVYAKMGSHVHATDSYLLKLRACLYLWIVQIDAELHKRNRAHALRQEAIDADGGQVVS